MPVSGGDATTIAAALTAPSAALREQAVQQLGKLSAATGNDRLSQASQRFVRTALAERVLDDDASVASAALSQPALLDGPVDLVSSALCKCLDVTATHVFGNGGGCSSGSAAMSVVHTQQKNGKACEERKRMSAACQVAAAALQAVSKLLAQSGPAFKQATLSAVLAAILPFCVGHAAGHHRHLENDTMVHAAMAALQSMQDSEPWASAANSTQDAGGSGMATVLSHAATRSAAADSKGPKKHRQASAKERRSRCRSMQHLHMLSRQMLLRQDRQCLLGMSSSQR